MLRFPEAPISGAGTMPSGTTVAPLRILLLDDSRFDFQLIEDQLQRNGMQFELQWVWREDAFRQALHERTPDIVLAELTLAEFSALAALAVLRATCPEVPLVVVSGELDEASAAAAIRAGVDDYVLKDRLWRLSQTVLLTVERARLLRRLELRRQKMVRLSTQLVSAQEYERKNLARELHDELGQRLSLLNILLYRLRPWLAGDVPERLWGDAERELAALVAQVRSISVALRPPGLDFLGLEAALAQLLARQFDGGPSWVFEYAGVPPRLPPPVEVTAYRLVQESVTNIVRYARANHVVVEINGGETGEELEIVVRDDGVGFDVRSWHDRCAAAPGSGLAGMRERVQLLGGVFELASSPGRGTRVVAVLPLTLLEQEDERGTGR
jgi:signal transduction histidine kinase